MRRPPVGSFRNTAEPLNHRNLLAVVGSAVRTGGAWRATVRKQFVKELSMGTRPPRTVRLRICSTEDTVVRGSKVLQIVRAAIAAH